MGCFCSKHDNQSEDPINEPRPQLTEPRYDNTGQAGAGNHSPPTPAPNDPAPHEIGIAVTTPDNTIMQQQQLLQKPNDTVHPHDPSSAPQAPVTLPGSAPDGENRQDSVRSRSSSSSSSGSNRETGRAEEGNRG